MANTLYVGTAQGDYASITAALQAAADGDVIVVKGSEYTLTDEKNLGQKLQTGYVAHIALLELGTGDHGIIDFEIHMLPPNGRM